MKQKESVSGTNAPAPRKQWTRPVVTVVPMAQAKQGTSVASSDNVFAMS